MISFAEKIRAIKEECLSEEQEEGYTKGWRKTRGLTGEELAELLGVSSKSTIHNYLTGKTRPRDREVLRRVEELWKVVKQRRIKKEQDWRRLTERAKKKKENRKSAALNLAMHLFCDSHCSRRFLFGKGYKNREKRLQKMEL